MARAGPARVNVHLDVEGRFLWASEGRFFWASEGSSTKCYSRVTVTTRV
jgi:hypothetical protein